MLDAMRKNAQGWGIKVIFGLIIIVFVFWGVGSMNDQKASAIAYVNEQPITFNQYKRQYDGELERIKEQFKDITSDQLKQIGFKRQVLEQLIDQALLEQKARETGITASDAEIRRTIARITAFHNDQGRFDADIYRRVLATQGLTPTEFEEAYRQNITAQTLLGHIGATAVVAEGEAKAMFAFAREKARAEIVPFPLDEHLAGIQITDEQAQAFYKENEARFSAPAMAQLAYIEFSPASLARPSEVTEAEAQDYYKANMKDFYQEEAVRARHILAKVAADAPAAEVARARKKIEDIRERIKSPKDFANIAVKFSEGPSAPGGGDLGWFGRGTMVQSFEEAAFALPPGVVSEPVRSDFGWHLILIEEKKEAGIPTFAETKDEIVRKVAEEKAAARVSDRLDEALARLAAGDKPAAIAQALELPLRTTAPFARDTGPEEMPFSEDDLSTIFALKEGEATATPMAVEGGYIVAERVMARDAAIRPFAEVRETILAELRQREALRLAEAEAKKTLETLHAGGALPDAAKARARSTEPFTRQGFIPGLGMNELLAQAVFAAQDTKWLPTPFTTPGGAFIARRTALLAPTDAEWERERNFFLSTLRQRKVDQIMGGVLKELRLQAKIEIPNPTMLE